MEQRSPKPQAAGLSPAGNASCVPCEGAAQIAGHLAAKVPDAAAFHPFTLSEKLNVRSAAYFDILTGRISGRFFFCRKGGSLP